MFSTQWWQQFTSSIWIEILGCRYRSFPWFPSWFFSFDLNFIKTFILNILLWFSSNKRWNRISLQFPLLPLFNNLLIFTPRFFNLNRLSFQGLLWHPCFRWRGRFALIVKSINTLFDVTHLLDTTWSYFRYPSQNLLSPCWTFLQLSSPVCLKIRDAVFKTFVQFLKLVSKSKHIHFFVDRPTLLFGRHQSFKFAFRSVSRRSNSKFIKWFR